MPAAAFIVPAVASVATSLIGSHAAKSSASQQQASGQSAANTFQPYVQGGNAAFNKALAMYGIPAPGTQSPIAPPSVLPASNPNGGMTPRYGIDSTPTPGTVGSAPPEAPVRPPNLNGLGAPANTLNGYGVSGGSSYGGQ